MSQCWTLKVTPQVAHLHIILQERDPLKQANNQKARRSLQACARHPNLPSFPPFSLQEIDMFLFPASPHHAELLTCRDTAQLNSN